MMAGRKASKESVGCGVCLRVLPHIGVSSGVDQHIRVSIAQLSVSAHVTPTVAREIVHQRHVDHQMGFTCKVDVLNLQVALLSSTARGDGAAACGEVTSLETLL